jgi:hypothetical protein
MGASEISIDGLLIPFLEGRGGPSDWTFGCPMGSVGGMNFSSFGLVGPLASTGEEERNGVGGAGRVLPSIDRWER